MFSILGGTQGRLLQTMKKLKYSVFHAVLKKTTQNRYKDMGSKESVATSCATQKPLLQNFGSEKAVGGECGFNILYFNYFLWKNH